MIFLKASVNLYSIKDGEIECFLTSLYNKKFLLYNKLKYTIFFENPVEITNIIGTFIENNEKYQINMWVSFDKHVYINITEHNADKIIRYIYERFPY